MSIKHFLILPYVNFQKDFSFETFRLWKNTPENWNQYFGNDNTTFLEKLVNTKGNPLKNIYVVTSDSYSVPYQKWERLVHSLFFIVLPRYIFRLPHVFADNFYFEIWEIDQSKEGGGYRKFDKFVKTIVSPNVKEKIYPSQYMVPDLEVNIGLESECFKFFEKNIEEDYNSDLLRSISYFFKTQYRNIAYFSEFEDIVNYCSAFQTFLGIEDRRDVGNAVANSLTNQFDLPEKTKLKLREWMEELYNVRSRYTHGDKVDYPMLIYQNQRHIDVAGQIFQLLVSKQYTFIIERYGFDVTYLRQIFESQRIFNEVIKLLTQDRAKEHFYSGNEEELENYLDLFWDLTFNTNIRNVVYENKNKLKRALKSLIYILEHICDEYLRNDDKKAKFYTKPLERIQKIMSISDSIEDKIEKIPGISVEASDPYNIREEIKVSNKIQLSIILDTFGKIREVYQGYNRL